MVKKVTIKDIADSLGVSSALVSFVMNGKAQEMRVSKQMADKVRVKAEELGYTANYMARALRTGKTNTLGLIVADISNSFFSKLAKSVENEAKRNGYNVIFGSSDENRDKSVGLMKIFAEKEVDGLIICASDGDKEEIKKLQERGIPCVLVDRYYHDFDVNTITVNNIEGTEEIIERLIDKGKRRIAFIGFNMNLSHMKDRFVGYNKALKKRGIPYDENLIRDISFKDIEWGTLEAIKELADSNKDLDAIYFSNYYLGLLGIKVLRELNKDRATPIVTSSFDSHFFTELLETMPLIYGIQPIELLGQNAVRLIIEQIESDYLLNDKMVLPITIIETS